jgi:hypothetical protein
VRRLDFSLKRSAGIHGVAAGGEG